MGYHITLKRPEPSTGISEQEWREFVATRHELKIVDEEAQFITAILHGSDHLVLHYSKADRSVFTKNPEGPKIIEYMASIAPHFGGMVIGDEGETFTSKADWGTQSDWNRPTQQKTFWQRELTPGNIIRMAILLFVVLFLATAFILKHFFPRH